MQINGTEVQVQKETHIREFVSFQSMHQVISVRTDSLSTKGTETTEYLCKRINLEPYLTYIPKLTITQLSEENIGENHCDLGLSKEFLGVTPKPQCTQENDKL